MMMTSKEVCKELNIDRNTLYRWIHQKDLPCLRIGRDWRFDIDEVKKWAENVFRKSAKKGKL